MSEQSNLVARLQKFLTSPEFDDLPEESLSEYWRHNHQTITYDFSGGAVDVKGDSGIYTPERSRTVMQKIGSLISQPRTYGRIVAQQLIRKAIAKAGMSFEMSSVPVTLAFDRVMAGAPGTNFIRSTKTLDFPEMAAAEGTFSDSGAVIRDYAALSGGVDANSHVFMAYYYMNIMQFKGAIDGDFSFLEIGAGNGNLAAQLLRRRTDTSYVVDLPRTMVGSISFLGGMYPDLKIVMPHEAADADFASADLVFLTPAQIERIPVNSVALASNTHSFQEMAKSQIATYFDLIEKVVRPGGHFFCANRAEKVLSDPDTVRANTEKEIIRFSEYPWWSNWHDKVHQVCPLLRLTQRDNTFLKLCQKPR